MTVRIPLLVSGLVGVAVVASLSVPAAATTPSTTTAPPTTTPTRPDLPYLNLINGSEQTLRVHPGEAIDIGAGCHIVDSGQPHLREEFLAPAVHYVLSSCADGSGTVPDWFGTVSKTAHNGTYPVSFTWHGKTYTGKVQVVGGKPPVITPTQPSQQVPVKPKGAPQTGGGGLADVVSSWG